MNPTFSVSYLVLSMHVVQKYNAVFLNELIDTLDELDPKIRTLLLVDFGETIPY